MGAIALTSGDGTIALTLGYGAMTTGRGVGAAAVTLGDVSRSERGSMWD